MDKPSTLIVHDDPKSPAAEAFRTLRTNISFAAFDSQIKKVLMTSAGPADGKSTVSANLAIAVAQAGKNCLIIDCDLRRPTQHKMFALHNKKGLVNLLLGDSSIEECCQGTEIPGLRVVTSGPIPPNPSELLGSTRMDEVLDKLTSQADFVVMDCPPVMAVADTVSIATKADGILLVVSAGSTPRQMALNAKNALLGVGGRLLGVVLNRVDYSNGYGYGYYNYNYYNYYASSENRE